MLEYHRFITPVSAVLYTLLLTLGSCDDARSGGCPEQLAGAVLGSKAAAGSTTKLYRYVLQLGPLDSPPRFAVIWAGDTDARMLTDECNRVVAINGRNIQVDAEEAAVYVLKGEELHRLPLSEVEVSEILAVLNSDADPRPPFEDNKIWEEKIQPALEGSGPPLPTTQSAG